MLLQGCEDLQIDRIRLKYFMARLHGPDDSAANFPAVTFISPNPHNTAARSNSNRSCGQSGKNSRPERIESRNSKANQEKQRCFQRQSACKADFHKVRTGSNLRNLCLFLLKNRAIEK